MIDPASPLDRFQEIVSLVCSRTQRRPVPTVLIGLLQRYYLSLACEPTDIADVRSALLELLRFLTSPSGRLPEHYQLVGDFVLTENEWEMDWSYLPGSLEDLLFDLSNSLCSMSPLDLANNPTPNGLPHEFLSRVEALRP